MEFESQLSQSEREQIARFKSPPDIQNYLDSLAYIGEDRNRTPLSVIRDRQCHCLDGSILAALFLRRLGYPPLLLDMLPEPDTDDDHVLAIFQVNGSYGAVAKSNFVGLRYREPVYRSLRELVMSYFEQFYNINGLKTLRGYTRPLNLSRFDRFDWAVREEGVEKIVKVLYSRAVVPVIDHIQAARLSPIDRRSYEAGMLGVNYDGLYKPAVGLSGEWSE